MNPHPVFEEGRDIHRGGTGEECEIQLLADSKSDCPVNENDAGKEYYNICRKLDLRVEETDSRELSDEEYAKLDYLHMISLLR